FLILFLLSLVPIPSQLSHERPATPKTEDERKAMMEAAKRQEESAGLAAMLFVFAALAFSLSLVPGSLPVAPVVKTLAPAAARARTGTCLARFALLAHGVTGRRGLDPGPQPAYRHRPVAVLRRPPDLCLPRRPVPADRLHSRRPQGDGSVANHLSRRERPGRD